MMALPLSAKFYNQVYTPANQLISTLASHPFAIEPESNILLHQFEGITLHTNHFAEKNDISIKIDSQFRDLANSIKHIRYKADTQIDIQSAIIYEVHQNNFRFIRNTILAKCPTTNVEFDAIEKLCDVIKIYFPLVDLKIPTFNIIESTYPFYEWAIAYNKDGLSAFTQNTRIVTVRKEENQYIKFNPTEVKFVVLEGSVINTDPRPHFPII
jgi:hypothetical protein